MNKYKFSLLYCIFFLLYQLPAQNTAYNQIDSIGRRQGIWHINLTSGEKTYLDCVATYKDDRRNGKFTSYYDNGNIIRDGFCVNDTLHGESKVYRRDGTLYHIEHHKMGRRHGFTQYFDNNGVLIEEGEFNENLRTGLSHVFSQKGYIVQEKQEVDVGGIKNTFVKVFSDDDLHELTEEIYFINDEKTHARYYEKGKLVREVDF
jgi:uncharacterized protein